MVKAALFDVFGTCVDWRTGVADFIRPILEARNLYPAQAYEIADRWRRLYDPAMAKVRDGERPYVTLDVIQLENLALVLSDLGIAYHFDADTRDQMNRAWEHLPAWQDTVPALRSIKKIIPIAACSNGSHPMMKRLSARAGLPWSMICGADTGRNFKPHSDVYLNSCAALDTLPEETVMVACHTDDLDAAASLGLQTAYFPRTTEWGSAEFFAESRPDRFTFHANTFPELVALITG